MCRWRGNVCRVLILCHEAANVDGRGRRAAVSFRRGYIHGSADVSAIFHGICPFMRQLAGGFQQVIVGVLPVAGRIRAALFAVISILAVPSFCNFVCDRNCRHVVWRRAPESRLPVVPQARTSPIERFLGIRRRGENHCQGC